MNRSLILLVFLAAIVIGVTSSIFVVDEREKTLVLQFGQVKSVKTEPGIKFKIPFIQNVVRYDDRILSLDTMPLEVTPLDDRRLVVDAFARYRIVDVVMFRKAVGTGGTASAEVRLERILNAALREVLGSVTSNAVTSADRVDFNVLPTFISLSSTIGFLIILPIAKIDACGGLIIAENSLIPNIPRFDIVIDPPIYCSGFKEFDFANFANSLISLDTSLSPLKLIFFIIGVISPSSIATATDTSILFNL